MGKGAKDRIGYHIEEYGKVKDRAKFVAQPAIWPRIEPCLNIIRGEKETRGRRLKVLDVGCSDGTVSEMIKDVGNEVFGIDIIPHYVEKAKEKGIKAVLGDIEEGLPFDDEFFDVVYAAVLLEHIFDTEFFLREASRVLTMGGLLIISVPNIATLPNRIRMLFGFYPKFVAPAASWPLGGHTRVFSAPALRRLVEDNGFSVDCVLGNYVSFLPTARTVKPWSRFLARVIPTLSEVLILSARRR